MTGKDLRKIREAAAMSPYDFGRALGYTQGSHDTVRRLILRYEKEFANSELPDTVLERLGGLSLPIAGKRR